MTLAAGRAHPEDKPGQHMFGKANIAEPATTSNCGSDIIHTENPQLSYVNPMIVEKMSSRLRAQTAECVMDTLGISVNTWLKMRKGMPIRKSVAERLLQRVGPNL